MKEEPAALGSAHYYMYTMLCIYVCVYVSLGLFSMSNMSNKQFAFSCAFTMNKFITQLTKKKLKNKAKNAKTFYIKYLKCYINGTEKLGLECDFQGKQKREHIAKQDIETNEFCFSCFFSASKMKAKQNGPIQKPILNIIQCN